jgi:DnaJ-class molecular chaperone
VKAPASPRYETRTCTHCRGTGWLVESRTYNAETGTLTLVEIVCPNCAGRGTVEVYLYAKTTR